MSRYDIAVGRSPEPEKKPEDNFHGPIVRHTLQKARGMAMCPRCGHSGEIKIAYNKGLQFICHNSDCNYRG
jgi:hypothetical protein